MLKWHVVDGNDGDDVEFGMAQGGYFLVMRL